jgi:hypothetical protein
VVDGSNAGSPVNLSSSGSAVTASFSTASLTVGTHTISASYSGDGNFTTSMATAPTQTVSKAATNAVVVSSANAPVFGQSIVYTASVQAVAPSGGSPTGTVQFVIDGTNLGSPVTLTGGTASSGTLSTLTVGNHTIQAIYSGDSSFNNTMAALTQTVNQASTSIAVISSVNPLVFGQALTLVATIDVNAPGAGTPSGTVQFMIDGANAGNPVAVSTSGGLTTASLNTTSLTASAHTISASYSGDSNFSGSTANSLTRAVGKASTTTVLSTAANPSVTGQGITFTATVSVVAPGVGSPSGTVQFLLDGSPDGSPVMLSSSGGVTTASFSTASLAIGMHTLAASYSGDASFSDSTASSFAQTVTKANSSTLISSSLNPSVSGQNVSFTSTVGVAAPGMGSPSGTVQFVVDGSPAGSPVPVAGGLATASFSTAALATGVHTVVASYSGDASFTASSATLAGGQTITGKPLSSTVVSTSVSPAVYGQSITFTASVSAGAGNGTPTGSVQFQIDGSNFGSPVNLTNGAAASGAVSNLSVTNHTIQALYSGDATFASSTASLTQSVAKGSTSTVVSSSPSQSVFGQVVSFTASISVLSPSSGVPTGTIQFMIDGGSLGTPVSLSTTGGAITASFTTASMAVGSHTIAASYSGDASFSSSSAAALTLIVGKATTSSALGVSAQASVFGQSVSFTATVSVASPGAGMPSGTVQFVVDGSNAGSPVNVSTAGGVTAASFSTASLATGVHTVVASYSGDASFTSSTATALTQTVSKAMTGTVLVSSANPSISGQSVIFSATVVPIAPGGGPLTGTVQFVIDGSNVGSPVSLDSVGGVLSSSFSTALLPGTHTIIASYSGDANFTSSLSSMLTQTVGKAATATVVSSTANPSVFGQSILFAATVTNTTSGAGTPTGTVQFVIDGANFGSPVHLVGGVATSSAAGSLSVDAHTIQAVYSGDGIFTGSTGIVTQSVNKATTSTVVKASINPVISGQILSFTATIGVGSPGAGTPSGSVQFVIDGANAGSPVKVNNAGSVLTASFAPSSLAVGIHTIVASYSGDGNFIGSTANAITVTVNRATSGTVVLSSASPSEYGQSLAFTAVVSVPPPGAGTPSGMVQFMIDGANFGTPVSLAGGVATSAPIAGLAVGDHTIQAVYSGDVNFTGSTGSLTQTINQAGTTTTLTSSVNPSVAGQSVSFTATIDIRNSGAGTPSGVVQFLIDGSNASSPVSVSTAGGVTTASLNTASLGVGPHTIAASYSGDGNFTSSTAMILNQTVNMASTNTLLTSSANPSVFGQNVIFTATVAASDLSSNPPTGLIQFQVDGTNFATPVTLTGGVARSAAISGLSVGQHAIQAIYSGDENFSASTGSLSQGVISQTASALVVSGFPSPSIAGAPGSFTVTVEDASGNTVPGYRGTIHFSSSDGLASLPADYTFTAMDNGVHTFNAVFRTAGNQSLTATDFSGNFSGSQSGITVVAAAADHLLVASSVNTATAGTPFDFTVTVQDAYDNTITDYAGTVAFSSADPYGAALPAAYTFLAADSGVHTFAGGATLYTAGIWNLTAADASNSGLSGSANVVVRPAMPDHLLVTPSLSTTAAGTPFDFTITVQDAYGNTVTGYSSTVAFSSADPHGASLPAAYSFTAGDSGVHTFAGGATLYTAGTWNLTAADASNSGLTGSANLVVVPAAPDHFLVMPSLSTTAAGTPFDFTVTVQDAYDNTVNGYSGTVAFSSADPYGASLPAAYGFTAGDGGVHTFAGGATLYTAGTWNLTATDTSSPGLTGSANVVVAPAGPDHFLVSPSVSTTVAGSPFDFTVTVEDAYNNTVTGYTGMVAFSSADPYGASLPAAYTFTPGDGGVHTFAGGAILYTVSTWNLTATDTSNSALAGAAAVLVTPAAASHFHILAPSNAVAGFPFDITIEAVDLYGNVDTNYVTDPSSLVHFSTTDPNPGVVLPPDFRFTAANQGSVTFPGGVILVTPGSQTLMAVDTASGLTDDGSAVVTVMAPGGGARLRLGSTPTGNLLVVVPIGIASAPSSRTVATGVPVGAENKSAPQAANGPTSEPRWLLDQLFATTGKDREHTISEIPAWNDISLSGIVDGLTSSLYEDGGLR